MERTVRNVTFRKEIYEKRNERGMNQMAENKTRWSRRFLMLAAAFALIFCMKSTANAAGTSDSAAQTTDTASTDNSAAVAAGEVWKCTQTLNTPAGYTGGPVRLELIQNVNGTPTASVVLQDQVIQFPYDLDITGAPGISEGTLYLSEQINGTYQELGNYSITFAKAE